MDNLIVFYSLNLDDGSFSEIYRIKAMEFFDFDIYLTCCTLSKSAKVLTCGSSDGNLKYNTYINILNIFIKSISASIKWKCKCEREKNRKS